MKDEKTAARSDQSATPESDLRGDHGAVTRHTPGPWGIYPDRDKFESFSVEMVDGGAVVAIVQNVEDFSCIDEDNADAVDAECEANAHLIAAAPDLLEACRVVFRKCVQNQAEGDSIGKLMAGVIAKAEGRS